MSVSRRRFLKSGALGGLAAAIMLKSNTFAFGHNSNQSVDHAAAFDYSRAHFKPHLGSTFRLCQGKKTLDLTLIDLTDYQLPSRTNNIKARTTESFVLEFQAPQNLSHASTYQLDHPKLGKFDLFLSPNGGRNNMIAVVNRIV